MPDSVIVASRAPMPIRIAAPLENVEKPGLAPERGFVILNGTSHTDAHNGMGITRNVDPEIFDAWLEDQKKANTLLSTLIFEISEDDLNAPDSTVYGFEPALEKLTEDSENTSAAADGSTVTHEGPVKTSEIAATSDTPNDDTPRGDPDVVPSAHTQTPAVAQVDPAASDSDHPPSNAGTSPLAEH